MVHGGVRNAVKDGCFAGRVVLVPSSLLILTSFVLHAPTILQKRATTMGILDYLDRFLGRFSDSDSPNGKRKRSWGATVLFWCCMPLVIHSLSVSTAIVIQAAKKPAIVKKADKANAKTTTVTATTPTPAPANGSKWNWFAEMFLAAMGLLFCLLRRHQDFTHFKEMLGSMSAFVTGGNKIPPVVESAFSAVTAKLTGDKPSLVPEKPTPQAVNVAENEVPR